MSREPTAQVRDRTRKRTERVLLKKGYSPAETKMLRGAGEMLLYFNSAVTAAKVRALLITNRIAAQQYDAEVAVSLDAVEEFQTYHGSQKRVA